MPQVIRYDNPRIKFLGEAKKNEPYFGIEIETENKERLHSSVEVARRWLRRNRDWSWVKDECSIRDGFEICSHPFTWGWIAEKRDFLDESFKNLREDGMRGYHRSRCGIHVHISKKQFEEDHLHRFLIFWYADRDFTRFVGQRRKNSFNHWSGAKPGPLRKAAYDKFGGGKCSSVNLCPQNSVELRIFRSNVSWPGILRCLETVKSSYEFTQAMTDHVGLTPKGYLDWLHDQRATYPQVYARYFTPKRRIIKKRVKKVLDQ